MEHHDTERLSITFGSRPARQRGVIPASRLLESATTDGHTALGWPDAGHLSVGARADLVAVDMNSVRTAGGGATVENAVFAAAAGDVTDVVIDGRMVVTNRRHHLMPDPGRALADAIAAVVEAR